MDISESVLRLMQLRRDSKGFFPEAYSEIDLTKGIIEDGIIKNSDSLVKVILKALRHPVYGRFDSRYAVLSVPESKSFVRVITVSKMSEADALEAVPFEAEQYIPMAIDQVYLDFKILSSDADKMKVVITASPKTLVDSYLEALREAKLRPVGVELESEAVTRCLVGPNVRGRAILILDISANRSNLVIYDQNSIQFTSSLPVGGSSMTSQIAQAQTIGFEEAEKIKRQTGLNALKDGGGVKKTLQPILGSIVEALNNAINFYREHSEGGRTVEQILLCGGGSKLKGLNDYLNTQMQTPTTLQRKNYVILGDPWVNVIPKDAGQVPPISKLDSISFATVIGLGLRGIDVE